MTILLASLPILLVLMLMVGRGWPAAWAGVTGAALALTLSFTAFDLLGGRLAGTIGVSAEAGFTSLTILWIVLPALAIHHLQVASGATETLRRALGRLSDDPRILALLIGWFFALFIEGAAGFGASVALAAPILVGLGYTPLPAVVLAMLGHAAGVSFGAIGTPIVPMAAASGLDAADLAASTADLLVGVGGVSLLGMVIVASRAGPARPEGRIWPWALLAGAGFLVPMWLLARFVGPELPTLAGSLVGLALFVATLLATRHRGTASPGDDPVPPPTQIELGSDGADAVIVDELLETAPPEPSMAIVRAAAPYLVLIVLVLVTRTVPPVAQALGEVSWAWELPAGFRGSIAPLTHPGTLLVASFLLGAVLQGVAARTITAAVATTVRQLGMVTVALVAMLLLARTMVASGMTDTLAEGAAGLTGTAWPLFAPLVGMLGTFVTGSATASNVLFTDLQVATATRLELPTASLLGAQNVGAGVGNAICPHNIVAASATVGLIGAEGEVLRRTLAPTLAIAVIAGGLAWTLF